MREAARVWLEISWQDDQRGGRGVGLKGWGGISNEAVGL